jgi:hypothetical protein
MTTEQHAHTIRTDQDDYTVQAASPVPGLWIYKIPDAVEPLTGFRWRLGHHTGTAIACALYEADVKRAAETIADLADWTKSPEELRAEVDADELYLLVGRDGCEQPRYV